MLALMSSKLASNPSPGRFQGTSMAPATARIGGSTMSCRYALSDPDTSPGNVKPGQAADGHVRGPTDAELVHAATPHRDLAGKTQVVHAPRLAQAAESTDLDVDDAAAAEVQRLAGVVDRMDALVQADRGLELRLQASVIDDVVVGQRLLDHHQVQSIQRSQCGDMLGLSSE